MKKIIAVILCVLSICALSVTAFAAESSPVAPTKVSVILRKGVGTQGIEKADVTYTPDANAVVSVKAAEGTYGTFKSWSIYKHDGTPAVANTDYQIVSGTAQSKEISIKLLSDVIICANYGNVITNPLSSSSGTTSTSPATGDVAVMYAAVVMLACAAVIFGTKKVLSK